VPRFNVDEYVDVQQRISRFWGEYPNGRIVTELMSLPDEFERVVFRAQVFKDSMDAAPAVTGWAAEVAGGQGANQTSWHENAETSAIGRALANMGYATSEKDRSSREEMDKANRGPVQPGTAPASQPRHPTQSGMVDPSQLRAIADLWKRSGNADTDISLRMKADFGKESSDELTAAEAGTFIQALTKEANQRRAALQATA
jgi:hypothetical protein